MVSSTHYSHLLADSQQFYHLNANYSETKLSKKIVCTHTLCVDFLTNKEFPQTGLFKHLVPQMDPLPSSPLECVCLHVLVICMLLACGSCRDAALYLFVISLSSPF